MWAFTFELKVQVMEMPIILRKLRELNSEEGEKTLLCMLFTNRTGETKGLLSISF